MNAQNLKIIPHPKMLLWAIDYIRHLQNVVWPLTTRSASSCHCAITLHTPSRYTRARWVEAPRSLLLPSYRFCCWPLHLQLRVRCWQGSTPLWSASPLTGELTAVQTRPNSNHYHKHVRYPADFFILANHFNLCQRKGNHGVFLVGWFWYIDLCGSNGLESNIQANAFSELSSCQFACS